MSGLNKYKKAFVSKKHRKTVEGKCKICGEDNYHALDVHRIKPGSEGGKYTVSNTTILCSVCHRKHHAGEINIVGWFESTAGRLLNWFDEDGNEHFS